MSEEASLFLAGVLAGMFLFAVILDFCAWLGRAYEGWRTAQREGDGR